jgi:hypothetical protein
MVSSALSFEESLRLKDEMGKLKSEAKTHAAIVSTLTNNKILCSSLFSDGTTST